MARLGSAAALLLVFATSCYGETEPASQVRGSSATLRAWGVPESTATDHYFEYGPTSALGSTTPVRSYDGLTLGERYEISETVTGLSQATTYSYRICSKERAEAAYECGDQQSFTTQWESWSFDRPANADRKMPDPSMVYADGAYHGFTSSATICQPTCAAVWVPHYSGSGLGAPASAVADAMPTVPAWVRSSDPSIWAPSVIQIGGAWVMYFAATKDVAPYAGLKCLGVATASSVGGPYTPAAAPLQCTSGYWNIDPRPVTDGSSLYLLWREDDASNVTGRIVAAELSADGMSFAGESKRTLLVGEHPWEDGDPDDRVEPAGSPDIGDRRLPSYASEKPAGDDVGAVAAGIGPIENPSMQRHPETSEWLLTWSANSWSTQSYATGLATCETPLGPCTRVSTDTPWLRTTADGAITASATFGGIGGLDLFVAADGHLYAVFHAYRDDGADPDPRVGWVYRVSHDANGYRLVEF